MYYFLEDVFPNQPYGFRILETPYIIKRIFDTAPLPYVEVDQRPGGYEWGAAAPTPAADQGNQSSDDEDVVVVD